MPTAVSDCAFVFGIPTTRAEYQDCINQRHGRDLIHSQYLTWPQYKREIVDVFARLRPSWEAAGASILTAAELDQFAGQFSRKDLAALVLFSHWSDRSIEFFDGMADVEQVAQSINPSFDGVLDLCVCNSGFLADKVQEARPAVTVKYSTVPAVYLIWFYIYDVTIKLLRRGELSYLQALTEAMKGFLPRNR